MSDGARFGVLACDVGKTGCRVALYRDGVRVAVAEVAGAPGAIEARGALASAAAVVAAADELGAGPVVGICAGVAGLGRGVRHAPLIAGVLERRFPGARIALSSDVVIAHAGALAGRPGVVVVAGTGSVALAIGPDGRRATADGWGYLLGDAGGGYAIGRAGLDAALRQHDGRADGSAVLYELARERFGALDGLPVLVHGAEHPAGVIASFAPDVRAAAGGGDAVAVAIWARAGAALAATAAAAGSRAFRDNGWIPVALAGGLVDGGSLLLEPLRAELAIALPAAELVAAAGDALDGAALLAGDTGSSLELLTTRYYPGDGS